MNAVLHKKVRFEELGLTDYQQAWDYQEKLLAENVALKAKNRSLPPAQQQATANHLLFCQHPHVYTLGKSGHLENLLLSETQLDEVQATFYKINRGGDITYHGPGQLVGYPILDLENFFTDIHRYMRTLEEGIIRTCADYGLSAGRIDGLTGVWLDFEAQQNPRKICALGVKCSRWVTMHGFAFNINTDLSYFGHIVPCGISDKAVTSLQQELGREIPLPEVAEKVKEHLKELFEMEFI
ncbi:MAG: lipoyl(octanoyl) transferase LipB [Spirosomataceae bacterium]